MRRWKQVLELIGILAAVLTLYYEYLWTIPEVHPNASFSSVQPFIVANKSNLFWMKDAQVECFASWTFIQNARGRLIGIAGPVLLTTTKGMQIDINPGHPYNFPCDPIKALQIERDGNFSYGNMKGDGAMPFGEFLPFKPYIISFTLSVKYTTLIFGRTYVSEPLTLNNTKAGTGWTEGPVADSFFQAIQAVSDLGYEDRGKPNTHWIRLK